MSAGPPPDPAPSTQPPFTGLVLAGGRSERMGTDKALLEIGGIPLVSRVAAVLRDAGASEVLIIGGDSDRLAPLGLDVRHDRFPGEGPLGGLLTGLAVGSNDLAFVTACDHPQLDPGIPRQLVRVSPGRPADAWVPVVDGVRQVLAALFHRRCVDALMDRFQRGERSVQRALRSVDVEEIDGLDPRSFVDLDTAAELERYLRGRDEADG